ncbi:MAG: hypothetical protein WC615_00185 [Mucilaginibacter sp.]
MPETKFIEIREWIIGIYTQYGKPSLQPTMVIPGGQHGAEQSEPLRS